MTVMVMVRMMTRMTARVKVRMTVRKEEVTPTEILPGDAGEPRVVVHHLGEGIVRDYTTFYSVRKKKCFVLLQTYCLGDFPQNNR